MSQRNHRDTTCVRDLTQDSWRSLFPLLERSSHRSLHNGCISSFQSDQVTSSGRPSLSPHPPSVWRSTASATCKYEHEHSSLPLVLPTTLHFSQSISRGRKSPLPPSLPPFFLSSSHSCKACLLSVPPPQVQALPCWQQFGRNDSSLAAATPASRQESQQCPLTASNIIPQLAPQGPPGCLFSAVSPATGKW